MATNSPDKALEPPSSAADTQTPLPPPPSSAAVTQTPLPLSPSSAAAPQTPLPIPSSSSAVTQTPLPPPSFSAAAPQTPLPPPPSSAAVRQTPLPPPPFSAAETQTSPLPPSATVTQTTPPVHQLPPAPPSKTPPLAKPEVPSSEPKASSEASVILVPSHSRWFSWDSIHECEVRHLPEFAKNPRVYKYYRNSIIKYFRFNPNRKITFTDVRKTLVGDVGSIRRVFDFLETWGLINYHPSSSLSKPFKWEDKDTKPDAESPSPAPVKETVKRICSSCKVLCTIACFACDKVS